MSKRKKIARKRGFAPKALGVLGLFALVAFSLLVADWKFLASKNSLKNSVQFAALETPSPNPADFFPQQGLPQASERPVFPFSVIPQGVTSAQELKTVLAHDPVAKAHYAGFSAVTTRLVRVDKPRAVHVSYRVGNRIYWTKNRMWLRRGETLISDGKNSARTRCGNRISDEAALPVLEHEPSMKMLEEPTPLPEPQFAESPLDFIALSAGQGAPLPGSATAPDTHLVPPPGVFGPPIGCCVAPYSGGPPVLPPPVTTPEAGTGLLLIIGILSFSLLIKKRL
jgi:hypothetical protein